MGKEGFVVSFVNSIFGRKYMENDLFSPSWSKQKQ